MSHLADPPPERAASTPEDKPETASHKTIQRRQVLKVLTGMGACALLPGGRTASAEEVPEAGGKEFSGILVDAARCIGCRACEWACSDANGLPDPPQPANAAEERSRQPTTDQYMTISLADTSKGDVYVRRACMHCNQPACVSACLVKAMVKTEDGPVIWREDRCMGCRYCMLSCPFDEIRFEYNKPIPRIRKCILCYQRLEKGQQPACVEACPRDAITFGKRRDLVEEGRKRIYKEPDKYVHEIFGEHEVGGTGMLYLSPVPFKELGLPMDLGTAAYPEMTKGFIVAIPLIDILWPVFLLGAKLLSEREDHHEP